MKSAPKGQAFAMLFVTFFFWGSVYVAGKLIAADVPAPLLACLRCVVAVTGLKGNRAQPMPQSDLYVLKYTTMPAVLIECGFMDSAADAPKKSATGNYCNGGFFANFTEKGSPFTLPAGPLVCDVETTSKWATFYCAQRGTLAGGKLVYPCGTWDKQFYGRRVELLTVSNGAANIGNYIALPACDYAIMGLPVLMDGKAVSFTQAKAQG